MNFFGLTSVMSWLSATSIANIKSYKNIRYTDIKIYKYKFKYQYIYKSCVRACVCACARVCVHECVFVGVTACVSVSLCLCVCVQQAFPHVFAT